MSTQIWFSDAVRGLDLAKGFFADFGEGKSREEEGELHYHTMREMHQGKLLPDEELPRFFFRSTPEQFDEELPSFFHTGFMFFKTDLVDLLKSFDMGDAFFRPARLFQNDLVTPIDQEVFLLWIGNAKETVVVEKTDRIEEKWHGTYHLRFMPKDDQIVTYAAAADGPDIWVDPRISHGGFFVTDRLANALIKAGMKSKLELIRTQTV